MIKESFLVLLNEIENHTVFTNASTCEQRPVWIQLAVCLEHLGCDGNGVLISKVARHFGIGNGTVTLYLQHVIESILSLKWNYIKWPKSGERKEISQRIYEHFGFGAIGIIDGTHIHLSQWPAVNGSTYWTCKH
ncbi:hypothetical protein HK096_001849, partial [Nowakowskiella sp. JEL0078]